MKSRRKKSAARDLLSFSIYILLIILGTLIIRNYVFERAQVVGQSMEPTFQDGDNLLIEKLSYRFGKVSRYDTIVFDLGNDFLIKRVYGLPGEQVSIDSNGLIYINGKLLDDKYAYNTIDHAGLAAGDGIMLKEGEYFVLGDNRDHSTDSRYAEVGTVKRDQIRGRVFFRMLPLDKIGAVK